MTAAEYPEAIPDHIPPEWQVVSAAPAHSLPAERAVLGAMLWSPEAIEAAGEALLPDDFYSPAHQVLYHAMIVMHAMGTPVDCLTVREHIATGMGEIRAIGGHEAGASLLLNLYSTTGAMSAAQVPYHAQIIRERSVRRRGVLALMRSLQTMEQGDGDAVELLARAAEEVDAALRHAAEDADPMAAQMTGRAFITQHRVHRPPLVPGLIHALDRLVMIGGEGGGKSTLRDQFACCLVAGVHPFRPDVPIAPLRVLIVDLENPPDLLQDRLEGLMDLGGQYPGWADDNLRVWSHVEGLNLRDAADVHRLAVNIRRARPQVVMAGPVKKMYRDSGETSDHGMVTEVWDRLRVRFGFALLLEHHAPMGNIKRPWRPAGSGIWSSWPETGMALTPGTKTDPAGALKVITFRGHRRPGIRWPVMLHRRTFGAGWPWEAVYPDGTLMDPEEGQ